MISPSSDILSLYYSINLRVLLRLISFMLISLVSQSKKLRNVIKRDRLVANRQPSNSLPTMNVCHIFWTVISGQIGRFSIRFPISRAGLGGVQRPNCSHNMRDVTAFVSPLSNHRCLTAPRTPREIIPSGHHSLSFPLHLAKNILKDIKRINLFNDQCSYKMKTHEQ